MNKDNQIKNKSGKQAKLLVCEMLNSLKNELGLNIIIEENYAIGYQNQEAQFKMNFLIQFTDFDNEKWLVKSTNSIRERIYGEEFFAQHIRLLDDKVTDIYVVVPDSIPAPEMRNKNKYASKIHSTTYTSFLTDVLTVNELREKIIQKTSQKISQGLRSNILGNDAEVSIVNLLNDSRNKALWNDYQNVQQTTKSSTYTMYKSILEKLNLKEGFDKILEVSATDSIPLLSNRGKPKTDVSVTIKTDTKELIRNISIKNTCEKSVTVHEGSVLDLISALNLPESNPIAQALLNFEKVGSKKGLVAEYPTSNKILEENLYVYNKKLIEFFIFGLNSPLVNHNIQIADTIIFTNKLAIWTRDDYVNYYIEEYSQKGQFGTPFRWTYPSKKRGQKIQIKGFSNN